MSAIEKIDVNFKIAYTTLAEDDVLYDVCEPPFEVRGLIKPTSEDEPFKRMPSDVAESVSKKVFALHTHTSGGRVRFATDSGFIGIQVEYASPLTHVSHMTLCAHGGFDLYARIDGEERHIHSFLPFQNTKDTLMLRYECHPCGMRDYTLNLPLYSSIKKLKIILKKNASVSAPRPYKIDLPVVFYGSSITQGACASRPGTCYQALASRRFDFDYINLGFSGSARGEEEMARYIATLPMSAFVYDYDHNAPSVDHLEKTHERMFNIIREANPQLPIICMPSPHSLTTKTVRTLTPEIARARREVIIKTVENAKAKGDKNVYFADVSAELEKPGIRDNVSGDCLHPNDLGFFFMADALAKELEKIFC